MSSATTTHTTRNARKVAVAALLASSIEWYDFLIYGTAAALVFATQFFPAANPVAGVLASFATFAVGFAARPLGGVLFGHFGDKVGRKKALVVALVLMAASTTLIGLLPSFSTIGVLAPVALFVLRVAQGIAVGGQWGGAMLLATEHAPANRRGLFGSFPQLGVPLGLVAGTLIYIALTYGLSPEAFLAWGWRIPFLLSVAMFGVALYIHRVIDDSAEFKEVQQSSEATPKSTRRSPIFEVLRRHPKNVLLAAGIYLVANATFYIVVTGILDYGTRVLGMAENAMLNAVLISMLGFGVSLVTSAWLSDLFGRKLVFACGAIAIALWAFALFPLIDTRNMSLIIVALFVAQIALGAMVGPLPALYSEMFPAKVRYSGASLGYQLAAVLGGGLAPFIMVALYEATHSMVPVSVYIAAAAGLALLSIGLVRLTPHQEVTA